MYELCMIKLMKYKHLCYKVPILRYKVFHRNISWCQGVLNDVNVRIKSVLQSLFVRVYSFRVNIFFENVLWMIKKDLIKRILFFTILTYHIPMRLWYHSIVVEFCIVWFVTNGRSYWTDVFNWEYINECW